MDQYDTLSVFCISYINPLPSKCLQCLCIPLELSLYSSILFKICNISLSSFCNDILMKNKLPVYSRKEYS